MGTEHTVTVLFPRGLPLKVPPDASAQEQGRATTLINQPCPSTVNDFQNATFAGTSPWLCPSSWNPDHLTSFLVLVSLLSGRPVTCTRHACKPGPGELSGRWGTGERTVGKLVMQS